MRPDAISRAVVDGIGAIVWEARPGREPGLAHFSFVSDGTQAMLGYPPSAWTGDPRFWLDITHPDDRDRVVGQILAAARSGHDADFEFRGRHADGHEVWLRNIVRVEPEGEGQPPRMSGVVVDITSRKLAEERLARVHAVSMRLSGLMAVEDVARTVVVEGRAAVGAVAAAVYALDGQVLRAIASDGYPEDAQEEMRRIPLDGRTPVAQVVKSRQPVWIGTADEADSHYPDRPAKRIGRGASCALPLIAEDRIVGALGVRMPEERAFATADRVLLDVLANACAQALLLAQAIGEEQAARASAERATALLDTIIEKAPEGWALFDRELRYVRVNEALARLNGVAPEAHVGRTLEDIVPDVPDEGHLEPLRRVLETGDPVELEVRGRTAADAGRDHTWLANYYPIRGAGGEIEGLGALITDITERKHAEDRAALLAALGPILDEVVGVEQRLERLARALVGSIGDHCTVTLYDAGEGDRVAIAHVDPAGERALALLPATDFSRTDSDTIVVEETTDEVLRAFAVDEDQLALMRQVGSRSGVAVAMSVRGRRIGTLAVGSGRPQAFGPEEVALVEEIARRAAIAVDNARLYESERTARERTARLQTITAALSEALSPADVAQSFLQEALPAVGAHMGGVWQVSDDRTAIVPLGQVGYPDPAMEGRRHLPLSQPLPMTDALRDGRVRWLPTLEDKIAAWPHLENAFRSAGAGSLVILPLLARGEPVGSISLSFPEPHALDEEDLGFLTSLTAQCAQALERARLYEAERRVAVTLQRSLLPGRLPAVEGVEFAVRYLPAAGLQAGGDFYEAIRLPGGRIGVAVGDVVGRGAQAAAAMGQLRSALRAFAMAGDGPSAVLTRLSAYAETVEGALAATAAYAVIDPLAGELRYACAGHPWPLLSAPGGAARFLEEGRAVPLACLPDPVYQEAVERLAPGDTLLLFTDGLTERRGVDVDESMQSLRAALATLGDRPLPDLLDAVVARQGVDAPLDDVALLAVRMARATPAWSRHMRVRATPETLASTRSQIRSWLAEAGVPPAVASDVLLAAGEALANAIEHAYLDVPGEIEVTLRAGHEIDLVVRDEGVWREAGGDPDRGRGFMLMRALMGAVEIERRPTGTVVRMRRRLADPPVTGVPAMRGAQSAAVEVERPGSARVTGDVDLASAPEVGRLLENAASGGRLLLDLSDVAYLDSAGARMLVELGRRLEMHLQAPPGSAARQALELADLDAALGL